MPLPLVELTHRVQRQQRRLVQAGFTPYAVLVGTDEYELMIGRAISRGGDYSYWTDSGQYSYMGLLLVCVPGNMCLVLPAPGETFNNSMIVQDLLTDERKRQDQEALLRTLRFLPDFMRAVEPWREGSD